MASGFLQGCFPFPPALHFEWASRGLEAYPDLSKSLWRDGLRQEPWDPGQETSIVQNVSEKPRVCPGELAKEKWRSPPQGGDGKGSSVWGRRALSRAEQRRWESGEGTGQTGRGGGRHTVVGSGPSCLKPSLPYGSVTLPANFLWRNYDGRLLVLSDTGCISNSSGAVCYPSTDYLVGDINKGRHEEIIRNNKWSPGRRLRGFYSLCSMAKDKRTFNKSLKYGKIRIDERKSLFIQHSLTWCCTLLWDIT